jgi:murein DD-endopeptidase MepM/ murein hydrolase activator NlpD
MDPSHGRARRSVGSVAQHRGPGSFAFPASLLALLLLAPGAAADRDAWHYPMDRALERSRLKPFGFLVDDSFYLGKESLFPTKFKGWHSGVDLEAFEGELPDGVLVPVYAVHDGRVAYTGSLSGYGGVILVAIDGAERMALYGHVKLPGLKKAGERVVSGEAIAYLGNHFSTETAGERKHLHFGIYKGTGNYFRGHEASSSDMRRRWEDPLAYLRSLGAASPGR